jgi:HYR domain
MVVSQHVCALLLHSQPPSITCPVDKTLSATAGCKALMPDLTVEVMTSDNCGVRSVTQSLAIGTSVALGVHTVTFTATDANGLVSSCTMTVTVVDTEEPKIDCGINFPSPYDPEWHFHPCDASGAHPLQFTATVTKENGCPPGVAITETTVLKCERCNGSNKVLSLPCNGITTVDTDKLQIANTNGVGTFISWKVKAGEIEENCGICIETPNNNDDEGCLAGKTRHRDLRSNSVFDKANTPFECPNDYPIVGEKSWPKTSLSELGCPV